MTGERGQFRLLRRTFFQRLFESELMPPGLAQVQLVIWVIAFLAAPSLTWPIVMAKKYLWIHDRAQLEAMMTQDRMVVMLVTLLATALITLVIWENLFPDKRDSRHLGVLPIRTRTFVLARLGALLTLFLLLFLGTTLLSSVAFTAVQAIFGAPGGFPRTLVAHFVTMSAVEGVVFFGILAVQCALLNLARPDVAQRAALVAQLIVVAGMLQLGRVLPPLDLYLWSGGKPEWTGIEPLVYAPPFWFLAMFECLSRGACGELQPFTTVGFAVAATTPLAAIVLYALSYKRLTRLAIEGRPVAARRHGSPVQGWLDRAARTLTRSPEAAGVCLFTLRTLVRSRQHRMLLAGWIGVALAIIISTVTAAVVPYRPAALARPQAAILVVPLVLATLSLVAVRMLLAIPTELKANWMFKLRQPLVLADAVSGTFAAMVIAGVLPAVLVGLLSATALWGPLAGVQHAAFVMALECLLAQALIRGLDKIPFTCTYYPGKAQIGRLWPLYLMIFTVVTVMPSVAEVALLRNAQAYIIVVSILAASAGVMAWHTRRTTAQLPGLRFEEEALDSVTLIKLTS